MHDDGLLECHDLGTSGMCKGEELNTWSQLSTNERGRDEAKPNQPWERALGICTVQKLNNGSRKFVLYFCKVFSSNPLTMNFIIQIQRTPSVQRHGLYINLANTYIQVQRALVTRGGFASIVKQEMKLPMNTHIKTIRQYSAHLFKAWTQTLNPKTLNPVQCSRGPSVASPSMAPNSNVPSYIVQVI